MKVYWGDIHNHCNISYGFGSLENALKRAASQLDFAAVTGHAMWPDMYERNEDTAFVVDFHLEGFKKLREHWPETCRTILNAQSDTFTTLLSYELHSAKYGDHHIVSIADDFPIYYGESPREIVEACGLASSIAVPHHIAYPSGYRSIDWDLYDEEISPIVEVISKHGCSMNDEAPYPYYHNMGPREERNTVYEGLRRGYHFGFVGSTDHHAGYPGSYGDGRMAVLSENGSKQALWEAIHARRTYAVSGDKILCDFRINGAPMGSIIEGAEGERHITARIETEYPLDKLVLYKNLKPIYILNGENYEPPREAKATETEPEAEYTDTPAPKRYKIRLEMGWGKKPAYLWEGRLELEGGVITAIRPYLRGQSVLAPSPDETFDSDAINDLCSDVTRIDEHCCDWMIETVGNVSTRHPSTSSIVFEVEGDEASVLHFKIQDKEYTKTLAELLEHGFTDEVMYYHSNAYKVYKAYPLEDLSYSFELTDPEKDKEEDFYHLEIRQKNDQYAFVTPIWLR